MRLINTETGYFEEFINSTTAPLYAILSHTWDGQEQSYQDVLKIQQKFRELQSSCSDSEESHTLSHVTPSIHQAVEEMGSLPGPSILEDTEPLNGVEPTRPSPTHPSIWDPESGLSEKIREACRVAREDGYRYIWVDSSCIDKTSSSELSEAINSMFNWYRDAQICYALLSDVPSDESLTAKGRDGVPWFYESYKKERAKNSKFRRSRWFNRSWTLQELIAPHMVVFLAQDWTGLGTKHSLAELIEEITHIDPDILTHKKAVADESVAERMRWAASREATRVEDEAYSLLGIFGITMTTVYGEGENAFQRLQEEILQRIPDRSLLAWCSDSTQRMAVQTTPIYVSRNPEWYETLISENLTSPFATSPRSFANKGGKIHTLSEQDFKTLQLPIEEYSLTPHGIRAKIRLISMKSLAPTFTITCIGNNGPRPHPVLLQSWYLILLGCQHPSRDDQKKTFLLGKLCGVTPAKSSIQTLEVADGNSTLIWTDFELGTRSLLKTSIDVYLPRPMPSIGRRQPAGDKPSRSQTTVSFSPWAPSAMPFGYTISELGRCPNKDRCLRPHDSSSLSLLLSNTKLAKLLIEYRHMPYVHGVLGSCPDKSPVYTAFGAFIEARIWIVSPNCTLGDSPPYASAIWGADEEASTLPIWYIPVPMTQLGDTSSWITLRLRLGVSRCGHYHAHVEVAKDSHHRPHVEVMKDAGHQHTYLKVAIIDDNTEEGKDTKGPPYAYKHIPEPHPDFKFTMLGSTKRALEAQGYSVRLKASDGNLGNFYSRHSYFLTISDAIVKPTFIISIRYFHNRFTLPGRKYPQFIFVARVTLSESVLGQGLYGYQDGPYVLNWTDSFEQGSWSTRSPIYLNTPHGDVLALKLDLDRAWVSEYYLLVNLARKEDSNSQTGVGDHCPMELRIQLVDPHDHINLTLPTHIRRALQTHGYEVHFKGEDNVYHLTLSDANGTINIDYFHDLSTGSDSQQRLTFRAYITGSVLQSSQDAAAQTKCQTVNWDAWEPETRFSGGEVRDKGGWRWNLDDEDVELELPNRLGLTLRLSFYLVWLSEYCITVE